MKNVTPIASKSPSDSMVRMTELVLPQHTNQLGAIFGGVMMSWIDIAAAIASSRHSGRTTVTASIDQLHFLRPVRKGHIVNISAQVTASHNTSCEVMVNVEGENVLSGETFHVAQAFLTFVALNEETRPVSMPKLVPQTEKEKLLMQQAQLRRKHRMKLKKAIDQSATIATANGVKAKHKK